MGATTFNFCTLKNNVKCVDTVICAMKVAELLDHT